MYYGMFVLGFVILICYNAKFYHVYGISKKRALWYSLTFAYGMIGANLMGRIYTTICAYNNIASGSRLAIFGAVVFAPLLILLTVQVEKIIRRLLKNKSNMSQNEINKIESISGRDTLDLLTPGLFITIALGKIGCMIEGCCFGVECSWGVYSKSIDATVFPVQLFESIVLFGILILCYYLKRKPFYRRGMAYPLSALLYAISRFCFEYLRYYIPELRHLVFGITLWQMLCIVVIVYSAISLYVLYKKGDSNPLPMLRFTHHEKIDSKYE